MIDDKSEKSFDEWMDSITFVNPDGSPADVRLMEDDSSDPEGDRGE